VSEAASPSRLGRGSPLQVDSGAVAQRLPGVGEIESPRWSETLAAWWERNASDLAYALTTIVGALGAAALVLELWRSDLHVPFAYSSDALFVEAVTKNLEHGWYYTNAHLAAPLGQQLYDFPIGNALNMLALKLLALVFSSPIVALNVFFLLTFPLTALAAFLVMRNLRISPGVSAACAVLFALLPYHFRRGEQHVFLSAYYAAPLIAHLVLRVLSSTRPFKLRDDSGAWLRPLRRRNVSTLILCVVVGASSPYYAVGGAVLIAIAAVIACVAHHSLPRLLAGLAVAGIILVTLAATVAPSIAYRTHHGTNTVAAKRDPSETELYAMKITDLVLPVDHHRLKPLARMKDDYNSTTPVGTEGGQTLGFIGTAGLLAVIGGGFVAVVRGSWWIGGATFLRVGAMTVVTLLLATTAGFSSVFSYTLDPQFHAWNRLSVLVAFFSFLGVAFMLDAVWRRWQGTRLRVVFPVFVVGLVTLGVLDQTSSAFVPPYETIRATYSSDARFVAAIERRLPPDAAVYQLPYVPFPESSIPGPNDYLQFRDYIHSKRLRWSYGSMKGRASDWNATLSSLPVRLLLPAVATMGFDGLTVDRTGYSDNGAAVEAELSRSLGVSPTSSADRTQLFYDLRPLRASLERRFSASELASLRRAAFHPPTIRWSDAFWPEETSGSKTWRWSKRRDVYFAVDNSAAKPRRMTLHFELGAELRSASHAIVFYPDSTSQLVDVTPAGTPVERSFVVAPGVHYVRISSDASRIPTVPGDPRSALYLRVANASIRDAAFAIFDRGARGAKP